MFLSLIPTSLHTDADEALKRLAPFGGTIGLVVVVAIITRMQTVSDSDWLSAVVANHVSS
jgi:hypothetical protein